MPVTLTPRRSWKGKIQSRGVPENTTFPPPALAPTHPDTRGTLRGWGGAAPWAPPSLQPRVGKEAAPPRRVPDPGRAAPPPHPTPLRAGKANGGSYLGRAGPAGSRGGGCSPTSAAAEDGPGPGGCVCVWGGVGWGKPAGRPLGAAGGGGGCCPRSPAEPPAGVRAPRGAERSGAERRRPAPGSPRPAGQRRSLPAASSPLLRRRGGAAPVRARPLRELPPGASALPPLSAQGLVVLGGGGGGFFLKMTQIS